MNSKRNRRKAAALRKQGQGTGQAVGRRCKVLADTAIKPLQRVASLPAVVRRVQQHFCILTSIAASGANMQGQATTSHNSAHDSCLASKQQLSCSQATTVDFAAVSCGVVVEVAGCKSLKSMPDRESCLSRNLDRAICISERAQSNVAKRCNRHRAVLSSKSSSNSNDKAVSIQKCGITADSSVQAVLSAGVSNHSAALMPGCSVASFDTTASVKTCK